MGASASDMVAFHPFSLHVACGSAKPPKKFPNKSYDEPHAKVYQIFPGDDVLSGGANNVLCAPIFNKGPTITDKRIESLLNSI